MMKSDRNYSKSKLKWEDEFGDSGENYLSENDEDVTQFRVGMEYLRAQTI